MFWTQINSLCYYSYAWYLALHDKNITEDCEYYFNKKFDVFNKYLAEEFERFNEVNNVINIKGHLVKRVEDELKLKLNDELTSFLDDVWETYGDKSGFALKLGISRELPYLKSKLNITMLFNKKSKICEKDIKEYYLSVKNEDY